MVLVANFQLDNERNKTMRYWSLIIAMLMLTCEQHPNAFARVHPGHSYKGARSHYGQSIRIPKSWSFGSRG